MRIVLLASLLVACGGSKDDKPAAAPGSAAAAAPAAPAAGEAAPGAPPIDDAACKAFTKDDAAALLGHPVLEPTPVARGIVPTCKYKIDGGPGSLSALLYRERAQGDLDSILGAKLLGAAPVEIAGVGTKAYRSPEGAVIAVLANGKLVVATAITLGKNSGPTPEAAEKVARAVAARL